MMSPPSEVYMIWPQGSLLQAGLLHHTLYAVVFENNLQTPICWLTQVTMRTSIPMPELLYQLMKQNKNQCTVKVSPFFTWESHTWDTSALLDLANGPCFLYLLLTSLVWSVWGTDHNCTLCRMVFQRTGWGLRVLATSSSFRVLMYLEVKTVVPVQS